MAAPRETSVLGLISGAVAGLGTVTAASGYILPWHGAVIGVPSGAVCFFASTEIKRMLGYDDTLDVFGVHGVGGNMGTLLTGVYGTASVCIIADITGDRRQAFSKAIAASLAEIIQLHIVRGQPAHKLLDALAGVLKTLTMAIRVDGDIEPPFANVDSGVGFNRSAVFQRDLALHAGLRLPIVYPGPARNGGRTKLTHGSSQGVNVPSSALGDGHPPRAALVSTIGLGQSCKGVFCRPSHAYVPYSFEGTNQLRLPGAGPRIEST